MNHTTEEAIASHMADFFASNEFTEKEQEVFWEMMINGFVVRDEKGDIVRDLKTTDIQGKRITVIGNHSAGLTQSLLAEAMMPQTFAQTTYLDSLTDREREQQGKVKTKMNISLPIEPLEYIKYSKKSEAKRYGNNKKHKKRKRK